MQLHLCLKQPQTLTCLGLFLLGFLLHTPVSFAQIKPDRTLGNERSVIERNRTVRQRRADLITGGAIRGETNLLHSFREFNINNGQRVYFANPNGIQNIFARVTGNNISQIRGLLGVDGAANLFLLNPNGIIFGEKASLDVRGSFIATTANSIIFNDNIQFAADATQDSSLLRISTPVGLQFGNNPARIINNSVHQLPDAQVSPPFSSGDTYVGLNVPAEQTLALVGGDITINGDITAPSGRIELGSVAGAGQVRLNPTQTGWTFNYNDIPTFGNIRLANFADVDASGVGGGAIRVQGARITLLNGASIRTNTLGDQNGENLVITATDLVELVDVYREDDQLITNSSDRPFPSSLLVRVAPDATGLGGNLSINTHQLRILDGALVSASTLGAGNPAGVENTGKITIRASDIELSGVVLDQNEPFINAEGDIFPSTISTFTNSDRRAGDITITTDRLRMQDGATLQTATQASGNAGNLYIRASEIEIAGTAPGLTVPTGLLTFSGGIAGANLDITPEPDATGRGGTLDITTRSIQIRDGAVVAVGSSNPTLNDGTAGNLKIQAENLALENQAQITAAAESVTGGNINLQLENLLTLQQNSLISASAGTDRTGGSGGNVVINAAFVIAAPLENNDITANAFTGSGGNITLNAEGILGLTERRATPDNQTNDIDASSEFGAPGSVTINSPIVELIQENTALADTPIRTELAQGCQPISTQTTAAFYNTGRSGLPPTPYEPLSSSEILADIRPNSTSEPAAALTEARGWIVNPQGQVILVAEMNQEQQHCFLHQ